MKCDEALILIYDQVDGEISSSNKLLLNEHLASCVHCESSLKSIEKAEKFYKTQIPVFTSLEAANGISKEVWARKNVFSLEGKKNNWSTQKIIYYVGSLAASFAALIYLTGSIVVSRFITNIDFTNISVSNSASDINFNQLRETTTEFLALLANINPLTTQSTIVKNLIIVLVLFSLQFAINYLFTQNKQDKKL